MSDNIIRDVITRTQGELYLGVVGSVRSGKSSFIRRFMELKVLPHIYDKDLYKKRNEVERYFLRLKRFRRVFTRYDKLDSVFLSIIRFAMIFDALFMWTRSNCMFVI